MALLKKLAILVVAVGVYAAYEANKVYVSERFENPAGYRMVVIAARSLQKLVKLSSRVWGESAIDNLKALLNYFESPGDAPLLDHDGVQVEYKQLGGVYCRIYRPKSSSDSNLPAIIYYHGGGYVLGSVTGYDSLLAELVKKLNVVVFSVDYRMAPEHPYPIPTQDCYSATTFIFKHAAELGVDVTRIALAGDSAGANAVAVLTQRFNAENHPQPKLQVLVYPWLQMWSHTLPSHVNYHYGVVSISKLSLHYLGIRDEADELDDLLQTNNITALVRDKTLRAELISYLDVSQIPSEYRQGRAYYNLKPVYPDRLDSDDLLIRRPQLATLLDKLRDPSISPLLAPEKAFVNLPPAYMVIVEWDTLKDEGLLYSERLRRAGTRVNVAFYEHLFHGGITLPDNQVAARLKLDLINFLKTSL